MTERIIEISETAASLSLENRLFKAVFPDKREITIPVAEIQCLILSNPAVRISGALLAALAENKAAVVVSGSDRMPTAIQLPLAGNYLQSERFRAQISASRPLNKRLWQRVVTAKIKNQAALLLERCGDDHGLTVLSGKVASGDTGNLEARAAVIYWKYLFSVSFVRDRNAADNNILLNYGYAVLRAMTARACCAAGLHPTFGINHHNRYDAFCLADDLMEPYRPVVDKAVCLLNPDNLEISKLSPQLRIEILKALSDKIDTSDGRWSLTDRLRISAEQIANSFQAGEALLTY